MHSFFKQYRAIRRASDSLVIKVHAGLPVGSEHRVLGARLTKKSAAAVRQVMESASTFSGSLEAGMLSRAYLANRVRWGLNDLGYTKEFVESITASIVVAMELNHRANRRAKSKMT